MGRFSRENREEFEKRVEGMSAIEMLADVALDIGIDEAVRIAEAVDFAAEHGQTDVPEKINEMADAMESFEAFTGFEFPHTNRDIYINDDNHLIPVVVVGADDVKALVKKLTELNERGLDEAEQEIRQKFTDFRV